MESKMSVASTAIVEGMVAKISTREVTAKATGEKIVFTTMLVVGDNCIANVRINTDRFELPKQGASVRARVEISTYRDDDEISLDAWL